MNNNWKETRLACDRYGALRIFDETAIDIDTLDTTLGEAENEAGQEMILISIPLM